MNRRFLLYCILIIQCLYSQSTVLKKINDYNIENKDFVDTIPIEFIHNRIFFPVTINGNVYRFVLDTGSANCTLFNENIGLTLRCDTIGRNEIQDANNIKKIVPIINVPDLMVGKIDFKNIRAATLNTQLERAQCFDFDGLIGTNILKDKILKIDIRKKIIILTDHKNYFNNESGVILSLEVHNNCIPYFDILPVSKCKDRVFLDTGNPAFYVMNNQYYNKIKMKNIQVPIADKCSGNLYAGMWGTGKDTTSIKLQLDDVVLGNLTIHNVKTVVYSYVVSSIGSDILNSGSLTLDYIHKKLIFIPYQNSDTIVSQYDFPPFCLIPENGKVKVRMIWKKSEAYRQGLRIGFTINSVNGLSIQDVCDFMRQWNNLKGNITMECLDLKNNPVSFHLVK